MSRKQRPKYPQKRKPPAKTPQRKSPQFGIDLTKCPAGWLPEATNTVTFTARIYRCEPEVGWVFPGPAKRITFTLVDVSHEIGICLNKGRSRNPDLWFPASPGLVLANDGTVDANCERTILGTPNPRHRHFLKATTRQAVTEFTITVRSEDFGSFGFLEASAPGCVPIPPREDGAPVACPAGVCCTGSNRVKIPRDDNGNNIADVAAQDDGGAAPATDRDQTPVGDGYVGDGLSNYEEYRGFLVLDGRNEVHRRTSIADKDIFILDRNNQGVGYFAASGLTIHFVRRDHLGGPTGREINFNRGFGTTGAQHGVRLVREDLAAGLLGFCFGGPGLPRQVDRAAVDPAAHRPVHDIRTTRAHELGHAVNVFHHGQLALLQGRVDRIGGLTSGDVACVMRYDNYARAWRFPNPRRDYRIGRETPGTIFCTSPLGTGVNNQAGGTRNNRATRGNCLGQLRVNDH